MTLSDLSPDALARLEAKLLADVEVVRRMRVLMQEHYGVLGAIGSAAPGVTVPSAAGSGPVGPAVEKPARKPLDEVALECLGELPAEGFVVDGLRDKLRKAGYTPRDSYLKTFLHRLIRQGKVLVHQAKRGRGGSTYRHALSRPESGENSSISSETLPAASVSVPAESDS